MHSIVETLPDNKVKLSITVDEKSFEKDIEAAFKRIAKEVRMPGFRPGKAPRRILEARLGPEVGREEALREALPHYYAHAIGEHAVDVIAAPEIEITDGQESGPVTFDAVVEVRPIVTVPGYDGLQVTLTSPEPDEADIEAQIERVRDLDATLETVDRPAAPGDHVRIDITGSLDDEEQPGLTADDYSYEIGRGLITPEVDERLTGASAGDVLDFDATHPDEDEERALTFHVEVKEVQAKVLPELTDEWASENSDFETVAAWRDNIRTRMRTVRQAQGSMRLREAVGEALAELVTDELSPALINLEFQNRLQELAMRLDAQGLSLDQYLQITNRSQEQLLTEVREAAATSAKVDLALRAVAEAEGLECTEADLDAEIAAVAERVGEKPAKVRKTFERNDTLGAVRSDVRKQKALDWLLEDVTIVDEAGNPLDRGLFEVSPEPDHDHDHDHQEMEPAE